MGLKLICFRKKSRKSSSAGGCNPRPLTQPPDFNMIEKYDKDKSKYEIYANNVDQTKIIDL